MDSEMEKNFHSDMDSDRFSDVPEPIRAHILSFLKTKDAVRTCILSSCWRNLDTWLPNLDLSRNYLGWSVMEEYLSDYDVNDTSRVRRESLMNVRGGFYDFLDRVFVSKSELNQVKLYVPGFGLDLKPRLDQWLDGAVRRRVKELSLEIGGLRSPRYSLPDCVLAANSITKLDLLKCELNFSSMINTLMPSLLELCLEDVVLNEVVMESLLASCVNIESYTFKNCRGLKRLVIVGLFKLEKVHVEHDDDVEAIKINAPNLLEARYFYDGDFSGETCCIEFEDCKNMKQLVINGSDLNDSDLDALLESLPLLENLIIEYCHNIVFVVLHSLWLVNVVFDSCRELARVEAFTPNLKFFTCIGEDPIAFRSEHSALELTNACLRLRPDFADEQWFVALIMLLVTLSHSESLTLEIVSEKFVVIPKTIRIKFYPPLLAVKNLMVEFPISSLNSPVQVAESLLWLAPFPESISISYGELSVCKSLKFMFEWPWSFKDEIKCECWKYFVNCWRHSLKTVRIENKCSAEVNSKLVDFFEKGKIEGTVECFIKNVEAEH